MKKIFSFLLTVATTLVIATSCADIPMPYELIDENPSEKIEAAGDGTKDNPFNVAGIIKYTKGLEADKNSDKEVYFTGIICNDPNIDNGQYGNATYYISDDGSTSNQFYIFRGFDLGNVKFTSKEAIKKGDKVVICGTVVNYKGNTPETVANKSYLVSINGTTSGNGGTGTTTVVGTKEAPLTVAAAKAVTSGSGYVTGYIVGYIDGQKLAEGAKFEAAAAAETELLLADAADCKDATLVLPVQLPTGDIRTKLNPNIAENIGKKVVLYGSFENYFGTMGMKSTSWAKIDGTEVGKDPDAPVVPIGEAKGDGTKENPFNVAGIIKYTTALGADKNSDKEVYFEGIISDDPNVDTGQYGNATFKISDDGTDNNTFYIFRAFDINNAKFTTKNIKKGDKVVICGTVVNYKGNTPETAASKAYLVSINGTTEGGNTTGGDDSGNTGTESEITLANANFEAWTDDATPEGWKSTNTASNATLAKSTDAHGRSFSVSVTAVEDKNMRLASKEIALKAGTYTFSYYAKGTKADKTQTRGGYAYPDGTSVKYTYNSSFTDLNNETWTLVSYEFTLSENTTINLVVMNPKKSSYVTSQDILVDDAKLTTKNGGLAE
jgi:hypothetical protein